MTKSNHRPAMFKMIMDRMIATGQAPGYEDIAAELGLSPVEGRKELRGLFSKFGFPGWLEPKTDRILSLAPFNNVPNNYRLTIDGRQQWFGQ